MEALARGTVSGLIEAATEKLPLDNLLKIASSPAGKKAIWNILEQMGTEATEEAVSYVANYIADAAAKDPNAEFSLKDMMLSALGGGLSGGIMGAGGTVVGYARNGNADVQAAQPAQESAFTRQAGTDANAVQNAQGIDFSEGTASSVSKGEAKATSAELIGKLRNSIPEISRMKPVAQITGNEFAKGQKSLVQQVGEFFRSFGNKVTRQGLGDVRLDEKGIKSSMAHGIGRRKAAAFAAVPHVIQFGQEIDAQTNWKNRGYDTRVFAAPITVGGTETNYIAAVVTQGDDNRYYLHEVLDQDGNIIYSIKKEAGDIKTSLRPSSGEASFQDWLTPQDGTTGSPTSFNPTLPQQAEGVNTSIPGSGVENDMLAGIRDLREPDMLAEAGNPNGFTGLVSNQNASRVSRRVRRALNAAGKKLGVAVVFDSSLHGDNGSYDPKTKTLRIAMDASDPLRVIFTHEATHRLKETSPELYAQFEEMALDALRESGSYDRVQYAVEKAYGEQAFREEAAAHFTRLLTEDIGEFEKLVGVNRNLAQKLLDLLDEVLHSAGAGWDGLGAASGDQDLLFGNYTPEQLTELRDAWAEMLQKADAGARGQDSARRSIQIFPDGKRYVSVDTDQNLFEGASNNEALKIARRIILDKFQGKVLPVESNAAFVNRRSAEEYTHPAKRLKDEEIRNAKMRSAPELDHLLSVSEYLRHDMDDGRHPDAAGGWDVYRTTFEVGGQFFTGEVKIKITPRGRLFYDITQIEKAPRKSGSTSTTPASASGNLFDPTVPQTEPGVNPHSMQEGRKYSRTLAPELAEEHGTIEPGEHPANDVLLPRKDGSGSPVRRTYRTAAESRHADERMQAEIEQVIRDGAASYQVSGDREAADYAEATLSREGFDGARGRWNAALESGNTKKNDIALGERLYVEAANRGDYQAAMEILGQVAAEATIAGQKVQAIRLIKRMGPAGELLTLEQTVRKTQKEIEPKVKKLQKKNDGEINRLEQEIRKAKEEAGQAGDAQQKKAIEREIARMEKRMAELKGEITIPDEVVADILSQKTQKGLDEAMTRAYAEIGKQVPSNWADKWNAWRYMAMLVNPTTHIRNITGNLFFRPAIALKDAIKIPMERALMPRYKGDPTAAFLTGSQTDKGYLAQGRESFEENRRMLMSSGKYNPSNEIRDNMRIFQNGVLEAIRRKNGGALEAEDLVFLRRSYERAYAQVLKANDYAAQDGARQAEIRKQAESWAAEEAWRATYRDASAAADAISRFSRINAATSVVTEGLLPFKKTPINVAKRGLSYSPAGVVKGLTDLAYVRHKAKIENGGASGALGAILDMLYGVDNQKIDAAHAIDQFASGLSGTAIVALGAYLASQGLLNGAGDDDDKARAYRKQVSGYQQYSLQIGDKSYTIDWLAPSSMPLFVGAELWKLKQGEAASFKDFYEAMKTLPSPMVEMSMLSSLEDAIDAASYGRSGGEKLVNVFGEGFGSYFGQAVPTLGGKINRIIDGTQRNAYYKDKTALVPSDWTVAYNSTIRQKVPGMSKGLEPKLDVWGREQKEGLGERVAENLVSPGYLSHNKETPVDKEILRLYEKTGESSVIPNTSPNKYFNAKGSLPRYDMSAAEYTAYMRVRGTTSYELINQMISSSAYKKMGDEEKAKMIGELYQYAGEIAKRRIAPEYANKSMDKAIEICTKAKLTYGQYLTVRSQADTDGNNSVSQDEAKKAIDASGLSRKQKSAMWKSFNSKWKNNPYQ